MRQRKARRELEQAQESRRIKETKERAERLPTGLRALWFRITGQYRRIKEENERSAAFADNRDRQHLEKLIASQVEERQALQLEIKIERQVYARHLRQLRKEPDRFRETFSEAASRRRTERRRDR